MKLINYKSLGSAKGINYSRDHLRRRCKAGEFPKPITVSDHRIAWIEAEIDAWLAAKKPARDTRTTGACDGRVFTSRMGCAAVGTGRTNTSPHPRHPIEIRKAIVTVE